MHKNINKNFREAREHLNLSYTQIANFLRLTEKEVEDFEKGKSTINRSQISIFFQLAGVPLREIKSKELVSYHTESSDCSTLNKEQLEELLMQNAIRIGVALAPHLSE